MKVSDAGRVGRYLRRVGAPELSGVDDLKYREYRGSGKAGDVCIWSVERSIKRPNRDVVVGLCTGQPVGVTVKT